MAPPLPPLTDAEIAAFVEHGYLIKRAVLDKQGCAAARDHYWRSNRSAWVWREDPSSWAGGFREGDTYLDEETAGGV